MTNDGDSGAGQPRELTARKVPELSPYGKSLLKQVKGSTRMLSAAAVARWGLERPDSIFHVLPEGFTYLVGNLPDELASMPELELEKAIGGVSRQDRRVRICLWEQYEKANRESRPIQMEEIASQVGLPSWSSYEQKLFQSPALLAWLMKLPVQYELAIKEGLDLGMNRLIEIMSLPLTETDSKGKVRVNTHIGLLILQCFRLLDQRKHGGYTQKNISIGMSAGAVPEKATIDMESVEKKLRELEALMDPNATTITDGEISE